VTSQSLTAKFKQCNIEKDSLYARMLLKFNKLSDEILAVDQRISSMKVVVEQKLSP
jgi:hypothetical protein